MSTLKVNTIQTTGGLQQYTVKAWIAYGSITTTSIDDSFNYSSITDNTVGDSTVALTNNMDAATYSSPGGPAPGFSSTNHSAHLSYYTATTAYVPELKSTSQQRLETSSSSSGASTDMDGVTFSIIGDYA